MNNQERGRLRAHAEMADEARSEAFRWRREAKRQEQVLDRQGALIDELLESERNWAALTGSALAAARDASEIASQVLRVAEHGSRVLVGMRLDSAEWANHVAQIIDRKLVLTTNPKERRRLRNLRAWHYAQL